MMKMYSKGDFYLFTENLSLTKKIGNLLSLDTSTALQPIIEICIQCKYFMTILSLRQEGHQAKKPDQLLVRTTVCCGEPIGLQASKIEKEKKPG